MAARMREGLFRVVTGETAATMQRASAGIVASGSATLEAAYFRLPFVLIYKVAWPTYLAARLVVNVKYLGMPNVLANKEVVPEFIQHRARPKAIALADDAGEPQYLQTVVGRGYRFVAPTAEEDASSQAPAEGFVVSPEELGRAIMTAAGLDPENPRGTPKARPEHRTKSES